jgi:hypothetical protein
MMSCGPRGRTRYPRDLYDGAEQVAGEGLARFGSSVDIRSAWRSAIFVRRLPLVLDLAPGAFPSR